MHIHVRVILSMMMKSASMHTMNNARTALYNRLCFGPYTSCLNIAFFVVVVAASNPHCILHAPKPCFSHFSFVGYSTCTCACVRVVSHMKDLVRSEYDEVRWSNVMSDTNYYEHESDICLRHSANSKVHRIYRMYCIIYEHAHVN